MKKLTLMVFLVGITTLAISGDIPVVVQKAFEQKFQNAKSISWETKDAPVYQATFKLDKVKYSASFNVSGEWLETETMLAFAELPLKVKKAYNSTYDVGAAEFVSKIETSSGSIKYGIKFRKGFYGFQKVKIYFSPDGTEIE